MAEGCKSISPPKDAVSTCPIDASTEYIQILQADPLESKPIDPKSKRFQPDPLLAPSTACSTGLVFPACTIFRAESERGPEDVQFDFRDREQGVDEFCWIRGR